MKERAYNKFISYKEEEHWFEIGRKKIFSLVLDQIIKGEDLKILDIGCGEGEMMEYFKKFGKAEGIELYAPYIDTCRKKGFEVSNLPIENYLSDKKFNIISFFDTLEHIEDDINALAKSYKMLEKNGYLIVSVPAFPVFWGSSDIEGEHFRRYRKKILKEKIENAGFKILKLTYYNHFLFPLIAPFLILKRIITFNNRIKTKPNHEQFNNPLLNELLKKILFKEADILQTKNFLFGLSLFVVAKKYE